MKVLTCFFAGAPGETFSKQEEENILLLPNRQRQNDLARLLLNLYNTSFTHCDELLQSEDKDHNTNSWRATGKKTMEMQ